MSPGTGQDRAVRRTLRSEAVTEDGSSWHILADPDGNEFCVLQPPGMSSA